VFAIAWPNRGLPSKKAISPNISLGDSIASTRGWPFDEVMLI
jgi:hypothetical protein